MLFKVHDIVRVKDTALLFPGSRGPVTRAVGVEGNQLVTVLIFVPALHGYEDVDYHSDDLELIHPQGLAEAAEGLWGLQPAATHNLTGVAVNIPSLQPQDLGGSDELESDLPAPAPDVPADAPPPKPMHHKSRKKKRGNASKGKDSNVPKDGL